MIGTEGSIWCVRDKVRFSAWVIRFFDRDKDPTFCNHVAVEGYNELLEHRPKGLGHAPVDKYSDTDRYAVRIYTPVGFPDDKVISMVDCAYKYVGHWYSWLTILCQGGDYLTNSRWFTSHLAPRITMVCSSYAALIATMNLGMAWVDDDDYPLDIQSVRPDDIDDLLKRDPRWLLTSQWG